MSAVNSGYLELFKEHSLREVMDDPELYAFSVAGGKSAFKDNCATCHGTGGAGAKGYPNLNDDDWLWGGTVEEIYQTIAYGIRSSHSETRLSQMPAFADMLKPEETDDITGYVLSLSGEGNGSRSGAILYQEHCASCHGADGQGDHAFGAPNLADAIWFYSEGDKASIASQIKHPKHGMMPAWQGRLSEDTIRQLAIYVHSLGGGE